MSSIVDLTPPGIKRGWVTAPEVSPGVDL